MLTNKSMILQIALKFNGQKKIDELILFRSGLELQRDLIKHQIKSTQNIINYEIVKLRTEENKNK